MLLSLEGNVQQLPNMALSHAQAHCRRLATGHLPAAAVQKVAAADEEGSQGGVSASGATAPASSQGSGALQERPGTGAGGAAVAGSSGDRMPCATLQPIRFVRL